MGGCGENFACVLSKNMEKSYLLGKKKGFFVDIVFGERKLEKTFNTQARLQKNYSERMARVIANRMAILRYARHLGDVPTKKPERCHALVGKPFGRFAVDLVHPWRLVFQVIPAPRRGDEKFDLTQVTAIKILDVVDYY